LATLRWANNLRDRVSGFRVAQLLPGIGPGSAARLLDAIAGLEGFKPPVGAAGHWQEFVATITTLHLGGAGWPAEIDYACRWYAPHLERKYEDALQRQADLAQLIQIAETYPTRERFLTELALDPPDATSDQAGPPLLDEDYLILSTIHSAKGQEWNAVFVLNAVDGCIPSDLGVGTTQEIEEERRLLYVAMTRAKDQLHIMVPQKFYTHGQRTMGGRHVYAQRTRFIPNNVSRLFQSRSWPQAKSRFEASRATRTPVDVKAKMRTMWE
jgi:DNA helicase-2/ATP-dependent DNA helicase PcrA